MTARILVLKSQPFSPTEFTAAANLSFFINVLMYISEYYFAVPLKSK